MPTQKLRDAPPEARVAQVEGEMVMHQMLGVALHHASVTQRKAQVIKNEMKSMPKNNVTSIKSEVKNARNPSK